MYSKKHRRFIIILFSLAGISVSLYLFILLTISSFLSNRGLDAESLVEMIFSNTTYEDDVEGYISDNQLKFDVIKYYLELKLDMDEEEILGKINIKLFPEEKLSRIDLNLYEEMEIKTLLVNSNITEYYRENNRLIINTGIIVDTTIITIEYGGSPKSIGHNSMHFKEYKSEEVVYTLNEPVFASAWFPCNDRPDDKALFEVKIITDSLFTTISNGKLISEKIVASEKISHWKTFYPISTYLISIYAADYVKFSQQYISSSNDTMNIDYYVFEDDLENAKVDFNSHPEMIKVFSELFGEYPFIKEKYGVAEFLWQMGAMENQTITGIGSVFVTGQNFFEDILVHELAHHWWGNAVGPKTWKDVWLNEGFATYSEALYYEAVAGDHGSLITSMPPINDVPEGRLYSPKGELFSSLIYYKGAWVVHMLRKELGDDVFFRLLREFYQKFKYKNSSTQDFENLCKEITGKDVSNFFNQWIYEDNPNPEIKYNWAISLKNKSNSTVIFDIEQIQKSNEPYHFYYDIEFEYSDGTKEIKTVRVDEFQESYTFILSDFPVEVNPDPNSWLLVDRIINRSQ